MKVPKSKEVNLYNYLGQRDMLAAILAEYKGGIKLPEMAQLYERFFKEKHFSHNWHTAI